MPNRNALIEQNLKFARACATKLSLRAHPDSAEWQDAFSAASEALVKCADAFDPSVGVVFEVYAWRAMKNAIIDLRQGERSRWANEVTGDAGADFAGVPSVEDVLIERESLRAGAERLERLGPEESSVVEMVLDGGQRRGGRFSVARLAEAAGLKVAGEAPPALDGAARSKRWYANLSDEKKQARQDAKNARRKMERAAAKADFFGKVA